MKGPVHTRHPDQLVAAIGSEIGASEWVRIDQPMVDSFAKLTGDEYFIHVDPERARAETQFGGTIAHGFLTMSLLANMAYQVVPFVEGTRNMVNYGFNRLRFVAAVPVGARVRGRFVLKDFSYKPGDRWQSVYETTVEIEGQSKPAIAAEWLNAGFFA